MTGKLDKSNWAPRDHAMYALNALAGSFGSDYEVTPEFINSVLGPMAQSYIEEGRIVDEDDATRGEVQLRLYDAYIKSFRPEVNLTQEAFTNKDPRDLWMHASMDEKQLMVYEYLSLFVNVRTRREFELPILNSAIMAFAETYLRTTQDYPAGNIHRVGFNKLLRIKCYEIVKNLEAIREHALDSQTEPQLEEMDESEEIGEQEQLIA